MWRFAITVFAAGLLPAAVSADDAVIRIEAKRTAETAAAAASEWSQRFDDVVTFSLPRGWTAIALGPQPRADAETRLRSLIATGDIPADSFIVEPEGAALNAVVEGNEIAEETADPEPVQAAPEAPETYIRLQAARPKSAGEAALAQWRKTFPEAGLWQAAGGWFVVTLGPIPDPAATAWLPILKRGGALPDDTFLSNSDELGEVVQTGEAPDLPAPDQAQPMPPLADVQAALRWAGRYDGDTDGRDGPDTQAAIWAQMAADRSSTDPGTAMAALISERTEWQKESGLTELKDDQTGLSVLAPMDLLQFDRNDRVVSIYGPKDGSGVALILFSKPGGQQELIDISGLITTLAWVPQPQRQIEDGHMVLDGANADHISRAEGWVRDGRAEGFVLIWPAADPEGQRRMVDEIAQSLRRTGPAANDDE